MEQVEILVVGLFLAVAGLAALSRAMGQPYPIALVLGGLVLGFVPGLPHVELKPEVVLVIFLPPLLYSGAFFVSLRDVRRDLRVVSLQAIGLVLFTMCAVAWIAHTAIDGLPWAAAFALGAIVAPTDPVAATTILRRLGAPRRIVTILEGESLLNDATALVAYRIAVSAAVGGTFSFTHAIGDFVLSAAGGIAIGLAVGWLVAQGRKRIDDVPIEITVSLLSGYAAYVPAERIGASGVLAAVVCGVYVGWQAPRISSAQMRLQGYAVWEILTFLLNATLFLLVGLQLGIILGGDGLASRSTGELVGYGALIAFVVIAARFVWSELTTRVIRTLDRRPSQLARRGSWQVRMIGSWSGMRGSVSLAAALALPLTTDSGAPFPERDLIVYLTFAVILVTLIVQGTTLPWLIRRLGVEDDGVEREEELRARMVAARAAIAAVDELAALDWTREDTIERMRGLYDYRMRRFKAQAGKIDGVDGIEDRSGRYQRMVHIVIDAQRDALIELRDDGTISSDVMHRIERELDLEEDRLEI
jgi:CPA1 family monovalent cation:H+ antiporter